MQPQHPDGLVSTTPGVAPLAAHHILHMPPTTWAHVPLPQQMGQEQGGCAVSTPLPGTWGRDRSDPGAGTQSQAEAGWSPAVRHSRCCSWHPSLTRRGTPRRERKSGQGCGGENMVLLRVMPSRLSDSVSCSVLAGPGAGGSSSGGHVWPGH